MFVFLLDSAAPAPRDGIEEGVPDSVRVVDPNNEGVDDTNTDGSVFGKAESCDELTSLRWKDGRDDGYPARSATSTSEV